MLDVSSEEMASGAVLCVFLKQGLLPRINIDMQATVCITMASQPIHQWLLS